MRTLIIKSVHSFKIFNPNRRPKNLNVKKNLNRKSLRTFSRTNSDHRLMILSLVRFVFLT